MNTDLAEELYAIARRWTEERWPDELRSARGRGRETFAALSAEEFLSKYCWVVYASGFKASALRRIFPGLRAAFCDFDLEALVRVASVDPALAVFGNRRKAECFLRGATQIHAEGYDAFRRRMLGEGMDALEELPGIGPVTKKHLARNIGLADVAKDDVWLVRIARIVGATSVDALAQHLSDEFGDGAGVVDLVLWKFCAEAGWKDLEGDALTDFVSEIEGARGVEARRRCRPRRRA